MQDERFSTQFSDTHTQTQSLFARARGEAATITRGEARMAREIRRQSAYDPRSHALSPRLLALYRYSRCKCLSPSGYASRFRPPELAKANLDAAGSVPKLMRHLPRQAAGKIYNPKNPRILAARYWYASLSGQ